ncbi:hypothetical protein HMPREF1861_01622 [Corynebacterium kroppenstedtii]|nr:hypothetical protein HMPREF1861_01622 [Corynebacterium kroppenstedtii]
MLEGALRYLYARKLVDKPSKQLPVIGRSSNFKRLAAGLLSILATFGGVMTLMSFKRQLGQTERKEYRRKILTQSFKIPLKNSIVA